MFFCNCFALDCCLRRSFWYTSFHFCARRLRFICWTYVKATTARLFHGPFFSVSKYIHLVGKRFGLQGHQNTTNFYFCGRLGLHHSHSHSHSQEGETGTSSFGSWHEENLSCQESGSMRDWVGNCFHRDLWTVHLLCGCIWPPRHIRWSRYYGVNLKGSLCQIWQDVCMETRKDTRCRTTSTQGRIWNKDKASIHKSQHTAGLAEINKSAVTDDVILQNHTINMTNVTVIYR